MESVGTVLLLISQLTLCVAVIILASNMFLASARWLIKTMGVNELWAGGIVMSVTVWVEMAVVLMGLTHGWGGMIMEQIMGVIMTNLGLVLGLGLLIAPPSIDSKKLIKRFVGLVGAWILLWWVARDGKIEQYEGWLLIGWALIVLILGGGEIERAKPQEKVRLFSKAQWREQGKGNLFLNLGRIILGAALMFTAIAFFLRNGLFLGHLWNLPMALVAGTILAWGVILPDLSTLISVITRARMRLSIGSMLMINSLVLTLVVGWGAILSQQKVLVNIQSWLSEVSDGQFLINRWRWFGGETFNRGVLYIDPWISREAMVIGLVLTLIAFVPALIKGKFYRLQGVALIALAIIYFALMIQRVL